jgi:hypothetical protein
MPPDAGKLKIDAYELMWASATPLQPERQPCDNRGKLGALAPDRRQAQARLTSFMPASTSCPPFIQCRHLGCGWRPLIPSSAKSIAFMSQRFVPGRDRGSFPDRTQFEKVLVETLQ